MYKIVLLFFVIVFIGCNEPKCLTEKDVKYIVGDLIRENDDVAVYDMYGVAGDNFITYDKKKGCWYKSVDPCFINTIK